MKQKIKYNKKDIISNLLKSMGLSEKKLGYIYLVAFISKAWDDGETDSKPINIYGNEIAKEGNIFVGHIYSAMKYSIEEAWFMGNYRMFEYIFGYSINSVVSEAPSPNKFVNRIVIALMFLEKNNADIYAFFNFIGNGGLYIQFT